MSWVATAEFVSKNEIEMSVSFEPSLWSLVPSARVPALPRGVDDSAERAQLRHLLRIVQEMLEDLEEQTVMGGRHTMEKVIGVLRSQIERGLFQTGPRNERMLSQLVDQLAREAARRLPAVREFRERAEPLVALLMATT